MDEKIRDYYIKHYANDELGSELDAEATFKDVLNTIAQDGDVYETMGVGDSIIRERLFQRLAQIVGADYEDIFTLWLHPHLYAIISHSWAIAAA